MITRSLSPLHNICSFVFNVNIANLTHTEEITLYLSDTFRFCPKTNIHGHVMNSRHHGHRDKGILLLALNYFFIV